jgi:hypothetical protein
MTALAACNSAKPPPAAATLESPSVASSAPPVAPSSTALPAATSESSPTSAPEAPGGASAAPSTPGISPPDPGRVDLVFTGDFAKQVKAEGGRCEDRLWLTSNDVLGFGAVPRWALLQQDELQLQLQVGPFNAGRVFRSPKGGRGIERTTTGFRFDAPLAETNGKPGQAHVKGTVVCSTRASGVVPDAIVALVRQVSSRPVRAKCTQDFGREASTTCVSVVVPGRPDGKPRDLVLRLREKLPPGWVAFVGTSRWLGDERHARAVEVVVGPGRDQLDILRLARSNGINYEMDTEALVKQLRAYHALVPIDIWHAETDTIELDLARVPPDVGAFAKDVYAFCPDSVDQGVGSLAALEQEIATKKRLFLWWD